MTRETGAKGHRGCIARIMREREIDGLARHVLRRPSRQDLSSRAETARLFDLCLFRSLVKNKESLSLLRRHPQACTHRVAPFLPHVSPGPGGVVPEPCPLRRRPPASFFWRTRLLFFCPCSGNSANIHNIKLDMSPGEGRKGAAVPRRPLTPGTALTNGG